MPLLVHYGGSTVSDCQSHTPPTILNSLIILVTDTLAAVIVAGGKLILVIARLELPPRVVKNAAVDTAGGSEFISKLCALLLIKLHNILASVPVRYSLTGARLFNMLSTI